MVLGSRETPPPPPPLRVTLATFSLFLSKLQPTVYIKKRIRLGGPDNSGEGVVSPRQVG